MVLHPKSGATHPRPSPEHSVDSCGFLQPDGLKAEKMVHNLAHGQQPPRRNVCADKELGRGFEPSFPLQVFLYMDVY
jgi:hypothetical protein